MSSVMATETVGEGADAFMHWLLFHIQKEESYEK